MKIEQIRYLVAIAEHRSINQAAQALYVSQPTLSKSIKSLETELGVLLINRSKTGITLTDEGERIYHDAKAVLPIISEWYHLANTTQTLSGTIHILITESAAIPFLENVFMNLHDNHPELHVLLETQRPKELLKAFFHFKISVCALFDDVKCQLEKLAKNKDYIVEELFSEPLHVLVNNSNPLARKTSLTINDIKGETIATYSDTKDNPINHYFIDHFNWKNVLYFSSKERIFNAVQQHNAITLYPPFTTFQEDCIKNNKIRVLPLTDYQIMSSYCLVYPANQEILSTTEQVVLKHLRNRIISEFVCE